MEEQTNIRAQEPPLCRSCCKKLGLSALLASNAPQRLSVEPAKAACCSLRILSRAHERITGLLVKSQGRGVEQAHVEAQGKD